MRTRSLPCSSHVGGGGLARLWRRQERSNATHGTLWVQLRLLLTVRPGFATVWRRVRPRDLRQRWLTSGLALRARGRSGASTGRAGPCGALGLASRGQQCGDFGGGAGGAGRPADPGGIPREGPAAGRASRVRLVGGAGEAASRACAGASHHQTPLPTSSSPGKGARRSSRSLRCRRVAERPGDPCRDSSPRVASPRSSHGPENRIRAEATLY